MTIQQKLKEELKSALREKNQPKLLTIRGLLAAFTNELVSKRRKPDENLNDEEALTVIRREAKRRRDAITQFQSGGREDLATSEQIELAYLQSLLPATMPKDELRKIIGNKIKELGIREKADVGKLVGAVIKELKGQADGADVKALAEELLY